MATYKLHLSKGTVALSVHIALNEIGADYELIWVDFPSGAQTKPDYLALNPKGRVPTLETPDGILTETSAILGYLAETHTEAGLIPDSIWQRAKLAELHLFLAATAHINHAHKMRGHRWSDDPATYPAMTAKVAENMAENAQLIERDYLKGPYVLGETYSTADMYLFTVSRWLEPDGVDIADFPKLAAFRAHMSTREAVASALEHHT